MVRSNRIGIFVAVLATMAGLLLGPLAAQEPAQKPGEVPGAKPAPRIEVVFVLDTTGSMSGLIEGAKQKIWSIANKILLGKPSPDLRIGLVGYRDVGDEYVTKVFDLTDNIDGVFKNLMSFQANGGGDGPEHVNKAISDSVTAMTWSKDKKTVKIIFLVGDAPPHVDYDDGFDYKKSVQDAVVQDIVLNTIRCGNDPDTEKYWQEIARRGEGTYTSIDQGGGMTSIATPMDDELAKLGRELGDTAVAYGAEREERLGELKESEAAAESLAPGTAADRAAFGGRRSKSLGDWDLLDAVSAGKVKLNDVKDEELPDNMKKMTPEERQKYLIEMSAKREEVKKKIAEASAKRDAFLKEKMKELAGKGDSFDSVVMQAIYDLAKKKGIEYTQGEEQK